MFSVCAHKKRKIEERKERRNKTRLFAEVSAGRLMLK